MSALQQEQRAQAEQAKQAARYNNAGNANDHDGDEDDVEDDEDGDWEDDDELLADEPATCLFCPEVLASASDVFMHCAQSHAFDLDTVRRAHALDEYGCIKLVNLVRTRVAGSVSSIATQAQAQAQAQAQTTKALLQFEDVIKPSELVALLADDAWLAPVMQDDAVLQYPFDECPAANEDDNGEDTVKADSQQAQGHAAKTSAGKAAASADNKDDDDDDAPPELLDGDAALPVDPRLQAMAELDPEYRAMLATIGTGGEASTSAAADNSSARRRDSVSSHGSAEMDNSSADKLDYYFASYSRSGIHEEMLKDKVRTEGYRDFMYKNKDLLRGKTVLDVGCGTGILCMFAARAGATKVIGIDRSNIIDQALLNVKENGLDHIITLIRGKVEDVTLPVDGVDIIISEWMGYMLLYESMLDTVLYARDKWLRGYSSANSRIVRGVSDPATTTVIPSTGGVYPDKFAMYMVALDDQDWKNSRINFWDDVYGFKMTAMRPTTMVEPGVDFVDPATIITAPCLFKGLDMHTVRLEDLEFTAPIHLTFTRDGTCHALASYFDTSFEHQCSEMVYFSTGPQSPDTHWKQTIFYLNQEFPVHAGDLLSGEIVLQRSRENHRALRMTLSFIVERVHREGVDSTPVKVDQLFLMD
ncbi:protein arginine methyltransferase 3 [Capsaspora owczarzaki ATCC 30864]|uniref:type I protein arginine methyltransferase n=1 Tax=Capsaspora owczarzaki (strain ATCC 30864) TaxID=595528 RepID=A0A0D2VV93_CAPO3|nr:protein arginine methyltransferase 3 [Capsaspora owczarzaki ATCC 30864]KJE95382.1 protein arginine methyltransferase 3 [Capsaspora owczarzaki ATCC 30864]|eukprot:XP_004345425.2 protein arginine methyltransferase 3 [Capsaspora owczarzaki ATCC 30864]